MNCRGVNIRSFKYQGARIKLCMKDVPNLVEADLMGKYACFIAKNMGSYAPYLSQLQKLVLHLNGERFQRLKRFPILHNVKELELFLAVEDANDNLLFCTSVFESCPVLHRFTLKMIDLEHTYGEGIFAAPGRRDIRQEINYRYNSLKVIEMVGFYGCQIDFEFACFVLRAVPSLEKLIIDPKSPTANRRVERFYFSEARATKMSVIRSRDRKLKSVVPIGVELVIR